MNDIIKLLDYVHKNNKYYKNIFLQNEIDGLDLSRFQLLTKQELQEKKEQMLSEPYKTSVPTLITTSTSGSSGIPVKVHWHNSHYIQSLKVLWERRKIYYGISPLSKKVDFTLLSNDLTDNLLKYSIDKTNTVLSFNIPSLGSVDAIDKVYKLINWFEPEWLYIQPTILRILVEYFNEKNYSVPQSIKYIESFGEMLFPDIKKAAEQYFGIQVRNMYGSQEMNGIAYECPYHNMHVLSENVYVECFYGNECHLHGEGEIVVTNLKNYTMPIIKYLQGDIVDISKPLKCSCGYTDQIIRSIKGRIRERININGVELNSFLLSECIYLLNMQMNNPVKQYNFIYKKDQNKLFTILKIANNFIGWENVIKESLTEIYYTNNIRGISFSWDIASYKQEQINSDKYKAFTIC